MPVGSWSRSKLRRACRLLQTDAACLGTFGSLHDTHAHGLAFLQGTEAGAFQHGGVDEHVLAAGLRCDEAEALVGVVPLHGPDHVHRGAEIDLAARAVGTGWARLETAASVTAGTATRRSGAGRALIDRDHLIHLSAFLSLADADAQRGTRAHGLEPGGLQSVGVQEDIAGA